MNRMNYFRQFMCFESFRDNRKAIAPKTPADSNLDTAQVVRLKKGSHCACLKLLKTPVPSEITMLPLRHSPRISNVSDR